MLFVNRLWVYPVAYLAAQIATGVEAGLAATVLTVAFGWSFAVSLGITVAIGYPIMLVQITVFSLLLRLLHQRRQANVEA